MIITLIYTYNLEQFLLFLLRFIFVGNINGQFKKSSN